MLWTRIKQFFCKHDYEAVCFEEVGGRCVLFAPRCKKCGKLGGK